MSLVLPIDVKLPICSLSDKAAFDLKGQDPVSGDNNEVDLAERTAGSVEKPERVKPCRAAQISSLEVLKDLLFRVRGGVSAPPDALGIVDGNILIARIYEKCSCFATSVSGLANPHAA